MTVNPWGAGEPLPVSLIRAIANAPGGYGVISGCGLTKGTGDWAVDVASGTALVNDSTVAVSSGTETLTDPASDADLDSGEFRVDLLSVDSGATVSVTEGTAGAKPTEEDIPAGETLLGYVLVSGDASALTSGDIYSWGIPVTAPPKQDPIFGDGSDGSITRSANANENGVIQATDYTVQSGVTMTVSEGVLIVLATGSITIDGTIDADGQGAPGGAGGSGGGSNGDPGSPGTAGEAVPVGSGGAGGTVDVNGGDGGDGDTGEWLLRNLVVVDPANALEQIANGSGYAGAGGGGGGRPDNSGSSNGSNGTAPGGGGGAGGGFDATTSDPGGSGGNGGGLIALIAPEITVTGTLSAAGADGGNGDDSGQAGAGGGGGGSGGFILLYGESLTTGAATTDISKGTGGVGGTGSQSNGGDGADGANGVLKEVEI